MRIQFRYGFSLVELSIVLAILGVVAAGGLSIGTTVVEQQANIASAEQLEEVDKAIRDYYIVHGFLPCPADPQAVLGSAGFGVPVGGGVCNGAGAISNTIVAGGARIGALPTRALGLRDRSIADEFGNRYIYAVTRTHTVDKATFDDDANPGVITVYDGSLAPAGTAHPGNVIASDVSYVIVSAGSDGKGARRFQTATMPITCPAASDTAANARDFDNCDNDISFRDARFNNGSVAASFFDDFIRWMPKFRLNSLATAAGSDLWKPNGDHIYAVGSDDDELTGNVGIGTTNPAHALHIVSGNQNQIIIDAPIYPEFRLDRSGVIKGYIGIAGNAGGYGAGSLVDSLTLRSENAVHLISNGGTIALTARGNSVGIGTTDPQAYLNVVAPNETPWHLSVRNNTFSGSDANAFKIWQRNSGVVAFNNNNINAINIDTQGDVGIGSNLTAPGHPLHIKKDQNAATNVYVENLNGGAGAYAQLVLQSNGGTGGVWMNSTAQAGYGGASSINLGSAAAVPLGLVTGNNPRLIISSGGMVGIGSAPGADRLTVNGDVLAANYYITSDARLKHDITPAFAEAALEVIAGIKPVRFVWNDGNIKDIGVIAQDVEKVFPEAISVDDKGFRRVAYDKLVLPVIQAIKELHKMVLGLVERITTIEEDVAALQKENAELKARIERLEGLLGESKSHKMDVNN